MDVLEDLSNLPYLLKALLILVLQYIFYISLERDRLQKR